MSDVTHHLCLLASEVADELSQSGTDSANIEIRVTYTDGDLADPTAPVVTTCRKASWLAGEWQKETLERMERRQ